MRKTGPVNDFAPTPPHGASAAGVLVRPAEPGDAARVARLLTLRGTSVEEARERAPHMIASLPVLLLALLPAADLYSVVNASNHASIGLHLVVGFEKVAQLRAFGAVTFEGGRGVLLRRAG